MISTARLKPVNFLSKVAFNAFDIEDLSSNINDVQSGFVIGITVLQHLWVLEFWIINQKNKQML